MRVRWWAPVVALLAVITWHARSVLPQTGIDDSWAVALNLAAARGLDFGHDVVFTYGPLGFLSEPVLVSRAAGVASWIYALVAQLAVAAAVLVAATRLYGRWIGIVAAFAALGLTLLVSDLLAFLALLATIWALERPEPPTARWLVPLAGFLAAFELLVKLNGGILCLLLFALAAWRAAPRGWRAELTLAASFVVSLVVLWLATRNSLSALPTWLRETRHVVGSYTDAMAIAGNGRAGETIVATLLVVAGAVLVFLHLRGLPRARAVCLALAAGSFTYAYLKEGFVRYDVHALQFFGAVAVLALAFSWRGSLRWAALAVVAGCVVGAAVAPDPGPYTVAANVRHFASIFDANVDRGRAEVRARLGVPSAQVRLLQGHTVDSVPYETSAIWAYGLEWRPEPLLQWYMAYDAQLDAFNASRIGADRVLVQRLTTASDAKVPAFEAPATYLSLLCNYRELAATGGWETLARTADHCGPPRPLSTVDASANQVVAVPAAKPDELVVAHVHLHGSHLLATLAKPLSFPHVTIGGNTYRLVAETATGPLVVREPASAGRSPFFGGYTSYDSFSLSRPATVEFDAIPVHARAVLPHVRPVQGSLAGRTLIVAGRTYTVTTGAFQGWVDVARTAGTLGAITGWAVDAQQRPAPLVAAFAAGRLVGVTRTGETRSDVADALHADAARPSGYSLFFPLATPVRVFALGGGKAGELNYPPGYPWG